MSDTSFEVGGQAHELALQLARMPYSDAERVWRWARSIKRGSLQRTIKVGMKVSWVGQRYIFDGTTRKSKGGKLTIVRKRGPRELLTGTVLRVGAINVKILEDASSSSDSNGSPANSRASVWTVPLLLLKKAPEPGRNGQDED
jgi:hypothetical protein